jgi:hypothetical protein
VFFIPVRHAGKENPPLSRFQFANGEADLLIAPRFFSAHGKTEASQPERALLLAVLSEAIETFQKFAFAHSVSGRKLFSEAEEWLWSENSDDLFSFLGICEALGLQPAWVRSGLRHWVEIAAKKRRTSARTKSAPTNSGSRKTLRRVVRYASPTR